MKRIIAFVLVIASALSAYAVSIKAKSSYAGTWTTYMVTTPSSLEGYTPVTNGRDAWNQYGSYRYLRTDSTGFFYVKKIDGRWWMIDPDGYAGINRAVCSFDNSKVQWDYDLCQRIGFNGSGNFLGSESQTENAYNQMTYAKWGYTRRVPMHSTYKSKRKSYYPNYKVPSGDYLYVLDPIFEHVCDSLVARLIKPYINERNLVGWFTDNELPFNEDQLAFMVTKLDANDPSRQAALAWAAQKGITADDIANKSAKVTDDINKQFAGYLAETYFSIVERAIRKVDTNHLILGSRLHGRPRANMYVVKASHAHTDVTSVNFYDRFCPNDQIAKVVWTLDHPCLIGEFYIKDINRQAGTQSGAGWYVENQANRGLWYQNTCHQLLANRCFVGFHYFRFMDDADGSNKGIVNASRSEYKDMSALMREFNEQIYALCDFYDHQHRDTSTIGTQHIFKPTKVNTQDQTLSVCYTRTAANRKSAVMQFTLPQTTSPVKHAVLRVYCTQADAVMYHLQVSAIDSMGDSNLMNRIAAEPDSLHTGWYEWDITTYVREQYAPTLTFKIHALNSTTNPALFASSTYKDSNLCPQLDITYENTVPLGFTDVSARKNDGNYYSVSGHNYGEKTTNLTPGIYMHNGSKLLILH